MAEQPISAPPFRVEYREETGEVVVSMTYGIGPKQSTRRTTLDSLNALITAVAAHRHEAFLREGLARALMGVAVTRLGADPQRLDAAVRAHFHTGPAGPSGAAPPGSDAGRS
ncbi:hypothetical protein [Embleya sp. NPDC059259]|uniref:hypothetical protein n=1 Tax=unclassified Embleya TaxID=2699296 RepID=UPI0036B6D06F